MRLQQAPVQPRNVIGERIAARGDQDQPPHLSAHEYALALRGFRKKFLDDLARGGNKAFRVEFRVQQRQARKGRRTGNVLRPPDGKRLQVENGPFDGGGTQVNTEVTHVSPLILLPPRGEIGSQ